MKIAKKIKIQVNKKQADKLWEVSKLLNNLYNCGLEQRIQAYKKNKVSISVFEQKREIPSIKEDLKEYQLPFGRLLHETLLTLDKSYKGFFTRVKKNKEGNKGFPRFRSSKKFFTMPFENQHVTIKNGCFYYKFGNKSKQKVMKLKLTEEIPENYKTVYLSLNKNGFFISFSYEKEEETRRNNNEVLAIDLGIKRVATVASTLNKPYFSGSISKNQRYFSILADKVRSIRDRKKKGSNRYKYYTDKLSRIYQLKKEQRTRFLA